MSFFNPNNNIRSFNLKLFCFETIINKYNKIFELSNKNFFRHKNWTFGNKKAMDTTQENKDHSQKVSDQKKYEFEKEAMDIKSPEELAEEAKLTQDDFEALGPKDLSLDMQDDENLKHRSHPVDFEGKDLDIPGRNLDDQEENTGAEDEENNHYSLGSEDNEDLDRGIDEGI
jgi:hypothetical protein